MVSPVDKKAIGPVIRYSIQNQNHIEWSAVALAPPPVAKIPHRIVFSGNMDFPPNYAAAFWFLDHVLPRIVLRVPDVQFVIAGANPPETLRQRNSKHVLVTGYVEDMNREIARSALYVPPLVSGGGFKNKIVEAIANRTYVIATPMAVEFLDEEPRRLIGVAPICRSYG